MVKKKITDKKAKKKDTKKVDDGISINFSIKISKDRVDGNVSCNPPKSFSEEDRAELEQLIKNSIHSANIFMAPSIHAKMRKQQMADRDSINFNDALRAFLSNRRLLRG